MLSLRWSLLKEDGPLSFAEWVPFLCIHRSFSWQRLLGVSASFFTFVFNLILIFFFCPLQVQRVVGCVGSLIGRQSSLFLSEVWGELRLIWHSTVSEYDTRPFYGWGRVWIEICVAGAKILDPVSILRMGSLRHKAIDLFLQTGKILKWGGGSWGQGVIVCKHNQTTGLGYLFL